MKLIILIIILSFHLLFAESEKDSINDWDRTFMPAIQMGYVDQGTDQISGGLMIQTSLEYRDKSNFVLRLNYDDFNSNLNFDYPVNQDLSFKGRISYSEFIGGVGYRAIIGKHNLTAYVQGGLRFFGYPIFNINEQETNLDFDSRNIGILRYSFGYEFAIADKLFFTIETLVSHTTQARDFWQDKRWSYGITAGLSAPLF